MVLWVGLSKHFICEHNWCIKTIEIGYEHARTCKEMYKNKIDRFIPLEKRRKKVMYACVGGLILQCLDLPTTWDKYKKGLGGFLMLLLG